MEKSIKKHNLLDLCYCSLLFPVLTLSVEFVEIFKPPVVPLKQSLMLRCRSQRSLQCRAFCHSTMGFLLLSDSSRPAQPAW